MTQGSALITGVSGMIGRALAAYLVEHGCEVHGTARFSRPGSEDDVRALGVTTWRKDLASDPLDDVPDVDYVFHEACEWDAHKGGDPDCRVVAAHNAIMASRVMHRWKSAKAVVLASTGGVHPESGELINEDTPVGPDTKGYHLGKFAMEQIGLALSLEFGTPTVILRYFWPEDFEEVARMYVRATRDGRAIPGTRAEDPYRWTPIDFADLCRYTARSVELTAVPPPVFVCGGPDVVSRRELVEIAAETLGVRPVFSDRPGWQSYLSDGSRLYARFGPPERHLPDVVRRVGQTGCSPSSGYRTGRT